MLYFETGSGASSSVSGKCTQIVVYNDLGEPISFVIQLNDTCCIASHFGDESFNEFLKMFKIESKNKDNEKIEKID